MSSLVRLIPIAAICLVAQACSTGRAPSHVEEGKPAAPLPVTTAIAPASPATPSSSSNTASATSKPVRIVLEDKTLTNDEVKALFAQGYKPTERNGEIFYCRREQLTGSRFPTMTCKTAEQMKQLTQESKDMLSAKQRPICAGGLGC